MAAFFECGSFSARDGEGRVLFEDVALSLSDDACVAIEGASGSGKSTLLRFVTGLAWSPQADRQLDGTTFDCAGLPAWRARVTMASQDAPMVPGSIDDNLRFPFTQKAGCKKVFDEERAHELMAAVGLARLPFDRMIRTLSGGERHRMALVRGLLWDPKVLVADEPLSGLDPDTVAACFELLLDFARRPGRLLISTFHDPGLNERADTRFRLVNGRLEAVS